jgi:hypothetical protein
MPGEPRIHLPTDEEIMSKSKKTAPNSRQEMRGAGERPGVASRGSRDLEGDTATKDRDELEEGSEFEDDEDADMDNQPRSEGHGRSQHAKH